jgi:hypothetical protein
VSKAIYTDPATGDLHVIHRVYSRSNDANEDDASFFAREVARNHPGVSFFIVDSQDRAVEAFFTDRYFRNAWCEKDGKAAVDMVKARTCHMERIRSKRNKEIAKLDVPFMKALEDGDVVEQNRIKDLKQSLRNIPQTIGLSSARTPDQLKALWPTELPEWVTGDQDNEVP